MNELYCYATLEGHELLIRRAAQIVGVTFAMNKVEVYAQHGYVENFKNGVRILNGGFAKHGFQEGEVGNHKIVTSHLKKSFTDSKQSYPPTNIFFELTIVTPRRMARGR